MKNYSDVERQNSGLLHVGEVVEFGFLGHDAVLGGFSGHFSCEGLVDVSHVAFALNGGHERRLHNFALEFVPVAVSEKLVLFNLLNACGTRP